MGGDTDWRQVVLAGRSVDSFVAHTGAVHSPCATDPLSGKVNCVCVCVCERERERESAALWRRCESDIL